MFGSGGTVESVTCAWLIGNGDGLLPPYAFAILGSASSNPACSGVMAASPFRLIT